MVLVGFTRLQSIKAEGLIATGGSQEDIKASYYAGIESSFIRL